MFIVVTDVAIHIPLVDNIGGGGVHIVVVVGGGGFVVIHVIVVIIVVASDCVGIVIHIVTIFII